MVNPSLTTLQQIDVVDFHHVATFVCILLISCCILSNHIYNLNLTGRFSSTHVPDEDNEDDIELTFINPCPNPNCVRCQKYKQIQSSAQRRLPHLVRHSSIQNKRESSSNPKINFDRIVDGVTNLKKKRNIGQHPTVLFIPRLTDPTSTVVTDLHIEACHIFQNESLIRDTMLQEYIESQLKDASWTVNDVGTTSSSRFNETGGSGNSSNNGDDHHLWEVLYLMNQGQWNHDNITKYCPQTYSFVISKVKGLMANCIFGNVFISVLHPGTMIEPHCGPTNIRHRLHYPLSVPLNASVDSTKENNDTGRRNKSPRLNILNETLEWEEGKAFVFDDSFVHSAEYPCSEGMSEVRVVLVIDLWHPSLTNIEREMLQGLYPPI
jgi:hypothetical protein